MRVVDAVHQRIKDLAKERNFTIYHLCKISGIPQATIATMSLSNTVKLSTIYGVCEGLGITLKDFFDSSLFNRENIVD